VLEERARAQEALFEANSHLPICSTRLRGHEVLPIKFQNVDNRMVLHDEFSLIFAYVDQAIAKIMPRCTIAAILMSGWYREHLQ
jgi:hypothetical protein